MSEQKPCRRRVLAQSSSYRVDACSCGLIHIAAGPVTLRMEPAACQSFTTVLARAMVAIARLSEAQERPGLRLVGGTDALEPQS